MIYQLRFGNAVRKIKAAIDSGLFGRIFLCDGYDKEYREPSYYANDSWHGDKILSGGGCLRLQSTHIVDLLQWFMGPVDSIFAKKRTAVHKIELEDLVVAQLSFRNGAIGVLESSTCTYPAFKSRIELHGENGSAIINAEYDELVLWNFKDSDDKIDTPVGFTFTDVSDPHQLPFIRHRYQLQDVIDAIKENREPLVTGEDAIKALVIEQAIYESTELGKEVKVKF